MKRNILIALALLVPTVAFGQQTNIQVGAPVTLRDGAGNETGVSTNPIKTLPGALSAAPCAATTVATTPTLILAQNGLRDGGGLKVPSGAAQGIYYSWLSATPGLTEGGTTFYAAPGSTVSFAGAPNSPLYAQAAASTVIACVAE